MASLRGVCAGLLFWFVFSLSPSPLGAQETGGTVVLRGTFSDNVYIAGGTVDVLADVERDLVAAGGTVNVRQLVKRDLAVAGGSVNLSARVGDDVRAAGGTVIVGGEVGGEVTAVGGTITLTPEAKVEGRAWLAGGRITAAGRISRALKVAAGTVSIAGEVDGDVQIAATTIEIGPRARIKGNLTYTSARPAKIDPGAEILGKVTYTHADLAQRARRIGRVVFVVTRAVLLAGLIVCGVILRLLLPGFAVAAARTIRSHPWTSLGLGFLLFVMTPVVAIVLMITIIGIPAGLVVGALYPVALLLGYLTTAMFLAELGGRLVGRGPELSTGAWVIALIVALVILAVIGLIPILGAIIAWLAILFGLGASSQQIFRRWSEARPASA
jgi:cytoskeletal protein CcmA (bactofilin family)